MTDNFETIDDPVKLRCIVEGWCVTRVRFTYLQENRSLLGTDPNDQQVFVTARAMEKIRKWLKDQKITVITSSNG